MPMVLNQGGSHPKLTWAQRWDDTKSLTRKMEKYWLCEHGFNALIINLRTKIAKDSQIQLKTI